jgi:hypothetical protein
MLHCEKISCQSAWRPCHRRLSASQRQEKIDRREIEVDENSRAAGRRSLTVMDGDWKYRRHTVLSAKDRLAQTDGPGLRGQIR